MVTDFLSSLYNFDTTCLILVVGVLISTFILRTAGTSPGGVLGAAFFVIASSESIYWSLSLLAIAPLISWIYGRYFSQIYSGREPAFLMTGMSAILATLLGIGLQHWHLMDTSSLSFPAGIILPAIIALPLRRQGFLPTYRYMAIAIALTLEAIIIIKATGYWLGWDFKDIQYMSEARPSLDIGSGAIFAIISIILGFILYRRYKVKSAGFVVLPLLAAIAVMSPLNFLLLLATASIVYGLASLLKRHSLIVGVGRYTVICVMSVVLVWAITLSLLHVTRDFSPFMGAGFFAALAVSVIANEQTMYGLRRTLPLFIVSVVIMASIEFGSSLILKATHHSTAGPDSLIYILRHNNEPENIE